jgi:hypothetical protein
MASTNRLPAAVAEKAPVATPRDLHTYHCLCSHLILASTQPLEKLPRRSALDKAYILSLPPPPRPHAETSSEPLLSEYAVLLSTTPENKPGIIRRPDGFEKMYMQRCGRCTTVVGYQLDKSQYLEEKDEGRKEDVVYILPGGLMTTEEMASGKDMNAHVGFQGVSAMASGR